MTHLFKLQITDIQSIDDEIEDLSDLDLPKVIGGLDSLSPLASSLLTTTTSSNLGSSYPNLLDKPEEGYRSPILKPVGNAFPDLLNINRLINTPSTPSISPLPKLSSPLTSIVPTSIFPASSSPMLKTPSLLRSH